ncbi:MAG TPA: putative Ig domain-containing protein [Kofleriaceae bacterium]|nr:putative Ig domain-containing protein [Kofleriaceae bacterium]
MTSDCGRAPRSWMECPAVLLLAVGLCGTASTACGGDDTEGSGGIPTYELADARQDEPYELEIVAGGAGPLTWEAPGSGSLPPGLTLQSVGPKTALLAGTPIIPGAFEFELTITEVDGKSTTRRYSLRVRSSLSLDGVTVAAGVEGADYEALLPASGGAPTGLRWNVVSGELPPGLRLEDTDQRVAALRGRPDPGRYLFTIAVEDGAGGRAQQDLELLVRSSLSIAAPAAPEGRTGSPYSWQLTVEGGLGQDIAWHVLDTALPPGLELASADAPLVEIRGVPVVAGTFPLSIVVEDGHEGRAELAATIEVFPALEIVTQGLPTARQGGAYAVVIQATGGGSSDYAWRLAGGQLPPGLSFSDDGETAGIFGVVTASGTFPITVEVSTPLDDAVVRSFNISVTVTAPTILTQSLPAGEWGEAYEASIEGESLVGGPVQWQVIGGWLPPGVVLEASSMATVSLSGTPRVAGDFDLTIEMSDGGGTAIADLSIRVAPSSRLAIENAVLPSALLGASYERVVRVRNASGPVLWTVVEGALPAGIALADGALVGAPAEAGRFDFELEARDGAGDSARARFLLFVRPQPKWVLMQHGEVFCGPSDVTALEVTGGLAGESRTVATGQGSGCSNYVSDLTVSADSRFGAFEVGSLAASSRYLVDLRGDSSPARYLGPQPGDRSGLLEWSPDATMARFATETQPWQYRHWVLDLTAPTPTPVPLASGPASLDIEWSPDGRKLAFLSSDGSALYVAERGGGTSWTTRSYDIGPASATWPVHWTPDSRRVVYGKHGTAQTGGVFQLDTTEAAPSPVRLTPPGLDHNSNFIRMSPDGALWLVPTYSDSYVIDMSTESVHTRRVAGPIEVLWIAPSPDGRKFLVRERLPLRSWMIIDLEAETPTPVPVGMEGIDVDQVGWAPDSQRLIVSAEEGLFLATPGAPAILEQIDTTGGDVAFPAPDLVLNVNRVIDLAVPPAERQPFILPFEPPFGQARVDPDLARVYFYSYETRSFGLADLRAADPPAPVDLFSFGAGAFGFAFPR